MLINIFLWITLALRNILSAFPFLFYDSEYHFQSCILQSNSVQDQLFVRQIRCL